MYYWKVSTALVFMAVFIFWEIIFSVVTWQVLAGWFGSDAEALAIAHQIRPHPDSRPGQQQQQALRAPTSYQGAGAASASNTPSRGQIQSIAQPPRQPQLQDDQAGRLRSDSDSDGEFEEEEQPRRYTSGQRPKDHGFNHDELEEDDDEDLELEHLDQRFLDDAVVPETTLLASRPTASASTSNVTQQRQASRVGPYVEDGSSSAGGSTTSSRRTVRSGATSNMNMSMSSSTSSGLPPPPPPPSVLSERSTDFQMSSPRRAAVESEYTEEEEEEEYQDDGNDTETGAAGEIGFEEEDFAEAALRSPGGTSTVRSRVGGISSSARDGRWESTTTTTTTTAGRSTGRSGGH